jgi:hypothetical protein
MGITTALRRELKERFYPVALGAGFELDTSLQPEVTVFRRLSGSKLQVFDIQWDSHRKPRFIINFAEATNQAIDHTGQKLAFASTCTYHCRPCLRLQRERGGSFSCWFQLRKPLLEQLSSFRREYTPQQVVDQLLERWPQMDEWWSTKRLGQHVNGS